MEKQGKRRNIDRRSFIKYSLGAGGGLLFGSGVAGLLRQVGAAGPGERVQIDFAMTADRPEIVELSRMTALSLEGVGIGVKIEPLEFGAWLGKTIGEHKSHMSNLIWSGTAERIDPSFFLTEFFHSKHANKGGRNYEHYRNPEYDKVCDAQNAEMNLEKRVALVHKCQEIAAKDYPVWTVGFGPRITSYNSESWEGPVITMGSIVGGDLDFWTWVDVKPKTKRTKPITAGNIPLESFSLGTRSGYDRNYLRLIYDTFLRLNAKLEVIPWLAKSWKVVNNTTVDIVLREGMKFHDGKPVTMEDVKFTFDYIKDRQLSMYKAVYDPIEKTEILDGKTFRFHLKTPYAPFITSSLVYAHILPKHIWEKVSDPEKSPNEKPVGNGPFKFGYWRRDTHELYLEANKEHFYPPKIDGLYRKVVRSLEATVGALESKEIDFHTAELTPELVKELSKSSHLKILSAPSHAAYETRGDLDRKPFNDIAFRRAVSHLLPRKDWATLVFGKEGIAAANSILHPELKPWYNEKVPFDEYSVEKAKDILKKAGYSWDNNGFLHYPG